MSSVTESSGTISIRKRKLFEDWSLWSQIVLSNTSEEQNHQIKSISCFFHQLDGRNGRMTLNDSPHKNLTAFLLRVNVCETTVRSDPGEELVSFSSLQGNKDKKSTAPWISRESVNKASVCLERVWLRKHIQFKFQRSYYWKQNRWIKHYT